jgi:LPXTG-motif cell wall-anchored protein
LTLRRTRVLASGCSLIGLVALAAVLTAPPAIAASAVSAVSAVRGPSGSAYALSVTTTLLDKPLIKLDPRPTASYPGVGRDSLARIGPHVAGLVTANALTASSAIRGRTLTSAADIADVTVTDIVAARVVSADCAAGPTGLTGRSNIAELSVLGQRIDLDVARGEFDVLGVATVRLDEQVRTGDTLTVNAVHVIVGGPVGGPVGGVTSADIVLSQAKCTWVGSTTTTQAPPPPTTTTTRPTTSTRPPTSGRAEPRPTTSIGGGDGIRRAASEEELAETGATGILPISVAGLILLAGGGWALFLARRGRQDSGS